MRLHYFGSIYLFIQSSVYYLIMEWDAYRRPKPDRAHVKPNMHSGAVTSKRGQIQGEQKIYRNLSFRSGFSTGMAQATYPPTGFFAQLARILVENSTGHACASPTRRSRGGAGLPVDIQIRARSPKRSGCPVPMSQGAPGPRFFSAMCGFSRATAPPADRSEQRP